MDPLNLYWPDRDPVSATCTNCGDPLSDHVEVEITDYDGLRCGICANHRPAPPPPPTPCADNQYWAERYCSASLTYLTIPTRAIRPERRLRHDA